ncbi:MAG: hypothetical protein ACYCQI_03230 [Gammaproteobacteria bacterium]
MTTRELIRSLPIYYKEYFESRLAIELLKNPQWFASVKYISNEICKIITANPQKVVKLIAEQKAIQRELFDEKFFGRFSEKEKAGTTPLDIMNTMLRILQDENKDLSQVMQIHSIYIYRMHEALTGSDELSLMKQKRYPHELFKDRGRKSESSPKSQRAVLSKKLGVVRDPVFATLIEEHKEMHECAIDVFEPDVNSDFFKKTVAEGLPFATGASGHTATLLLGAKTFSVDLQEYALAIYAFLTSGGNHSFHEVMIVAKQMGAHYEVNNYLVSIPDAIKQTDKFRQFTEEFSEFLTAEKSGSCERVRYENLLSQIHFTRIVHRELDAVLPAEGKLAGLVLQYGIR